MLNPRDFAAIQRHDFWMATSYDRDWDCEDDDHDDDHQDDAHDAWAEDADNE